MTSTNPALWIPTALSFPWSWLSLFSLPGPALQASTQWLSSLPFLGVPRDRTVQHSLTPKLGNSDRSLLKLLLGTVPGLNAGNFPSGNMLQQSRNPVWLDYKYAWYWDQCELFFESHSFFHISSNPLLPYFYKFCILKLSCSSSIQLSKFCLTFCLQLKLQNVFSKTLPCFLFDHRSHPLELYALCSKHWSGLSLLFCSPILLKVLPVHYWNFSVF